ncbi:hypothetical protein LAV72_10940 [Lysinibacillus xylanilyticus]|uniref:hypothetical protein n=1 Tax=Lysinibacillus xylanilyticus TaxID=582475 RepID=UPI002B24D237|nr:hypothetical protein [Lysinibacillus xylanilyticus]MEB2300134.1 hypothetical protein [Lysinibacillus xylanilyticus]
MEDSKLYSTQDIEKLKQQIEAYKDTLTSLKMGASIEDYLFMKMDIDEIKTQMALLEDLTETIDDKQKNPQIKGYEEQIKLLSAQIEYLNQTIEDMNREILKVLNKLRTIENTEAPTTPTKTENISTFIANSARRDPIITQTTSQSANTSKQPSYKMLQSLAGKATNAQLDVNNNNGIPSTRNGDQRDVPEERHFNQQYFQSINTHPSQIYNGLYRNTKTESTFHFKHATSKQEIPVNMNEPALLPDNASPPDNYRKKNTAVTVDEMNSELTNEPGNHETFKNVNESGILEATETANESNVLEAAETVNDSGILVAVETVNEPAILVAVETVNKPVILEAVETVNKPVILEVAETVNEPAILEATETVHEPVILEVANVVNEQEDTNQSPILKGDECEIFEPTSGEVCETQAQIEEVNKQPELKEESPEESRKKDKGSLFFNFFRKWS